MSNHRLITDSEEEILDLSARQRVSAPLTPLRNLSATIGSQVRAPTVPPPLSSVLSRAFPEQSGHKNKATVASLAHSSPG